jgi:hypothetical protein
MCPKDRLFKGYIELELQVNRILNFINILMILMKKINLIYIKATGI